LKPLDYLYALELHGIKLGLDNIRTLLDAGGNPHCAYPTVHVAGTNGKGSVVAMLDAIVRAAGYRTGRFTSPHLISVRERFLVDGEPIAKADLERIIARFRELAEARGLLPTFFEMCTAVAFQYFAESGVDMAVIEVGMGGRFDSTNVLRPEATAITRIGLEHTRYLGDTLAKIAFEKAGILKPGVPGVVAPQAPEAFEVIAARARDVGAPLRCVGADVSFHFDAGRRFAYAGDSVSLQGVSLGLPGGYQGANAAVAAALAEALREKFPNLDTKSIRAGLESARWPCRLETVLRDPEVIVDVAHNLAGAEVLAEALPDRCVLALAIANDKDAAGMIRVLRPKAAHLLLTQFDNKRSLTAAELSERAGETPHERLDSVLDAVRRGMALARDTGLPFVIAGSMFTAGEARHILIREYNAPRLQF